MLKRSLHKKIETVLITSITILLTSTHFPFISNTSHYTKKFSIMDLFSKCDQICSFLHIYWRNPWLKTWFFAKFLFFKTLPWRSSLSYRNKSIDLLWKSIDWFLYDRDLRHEIVKGLYYSGGIQWNSVALN